ncbi:MAG: molybdate ABC transporter substrate-binding protein [Desulfomonile tiedjei]|uniref:Molybdate ABC transporter substrate-binding protein n=1 Tax=Desulfomonile tiedjei TaxID=2358 RepID=A0A9D6V9G0_9BACT|nr:molybdate ABC transporter substrate-binding protein [Desulfomonile tiedjei]
MRLLRRKWFTISAMAALLLAGPVGVSRASDAVTVFAAASLTNAITDLGNMFAGKGGSNVTSSFAASSTLAKQIENGAPANVFLSADEAWMNYLSEKRLIVPDTRFDLVGNKLVFVAPLDSKLKLDVHQSFPLAQLLGDGRLATGDPDHVPVGKYAKSALQKLGVWATVEGKLARADSVRAGLALVERGECPLGIVYSTDAAISKKVKIVGTFPEGSYPPITYPAALIAGKDTEAARSFLNFLKTPEAKAVFEKYGFAVR